jgi:hypothetical protein
MPSGLFFCRMVLLMCAGSVVVQCRIARLRADVEPVPENTPVARFFKYAFVRLDEGDVKSLAIVMKNAFTNLCVELKGCGRTEAELEDLYQRRYNELEISISKMRKMGFLLQRLVAGVERDGDQGARSL